MRLLKRKKEGKADIVPKEDILHGSVRYLKGEKYTVEANLARYFANNGWLEGEHPAPPPAVSIQVDNANHGLEDSNG